MSENGERTSEDIPSLMQQFLRGLLIPFILVMWSIMMLGAVSIVVKRINVAAGGSNLAAEASLSPTGEASGGHSVAAPFNVAEQETSRGSVPEFRNAGLGNSPVSAAPFPRPVQGITRRGDAFVLTRFSKGPLREFTVKFSHPNTMVDR